MVPYSYLLAKRIVVYFIYLDFLLYMTNIKQMRVDALEEIRDMETILQEDTTSQHREEIKDNIRNLLEK